MDIQELNEQLAKIAFVLEEEAAQISNMEVHNEDKINQYGVVTNKKFAHFHWVYNNAVHFKFSNRCPKTKAELKQMVAFPDEVKTLSSKDYKDILSDLRKKWKLKNGTQTTVYEALKSMWEDLHDYRDISTELIKL